MQIKNSKNHWFLGLSSFQVLAMFRRGLFYVFLSIYLRFFLGLSVTETTLFATLPMILNVICQMFVWGVISDKFQLRRTLVILGEILAGSGTLIVFFLHRIVSERLIAGWIIILGLSFVEIFWSMSNTGWTALISDLFPYKERNAIQGRLASLGGLGRIFGVFIGGYLYNGGLGFYEGNLFLIASLIMFISTIPMFYIPEGGINYKSENNGAKSSEDNQKRSFFSTIVFSIFLIAMLFINFGRNSIAIILSQYLVLESGFAVSSELLSYIINTQSVAIIFTGFIVGWAARKFGEGITLSIGVLIAILSLVLIAIAPNLTIIIIGIYLRGTSDVIILASSYTFASNLITTRNRAKLFGVYNATFFLSWGLAGTLIAGPVVDILLAKNINEVLAYQVAFIISAFISFIGLIILISSLILFFLRKEKEL